MSLLLILEISESHTALEIIKAGVALHGNSSNTQQPTLHVWSQTSGLRQLECNKISINIQ